MELTPEIQAYIDKAVRDAVAQALRKRDEADEQAERDREYYQDLAEEHRRKRAEAEVRRFEEEQRRLRWRIEDMEAGRGR